MAFTVVSHNVFGAPGIGGTISRIRQICAAIAAEQPDAIMLQEVYTWGVLRL